MLLLQQARRLVAALRPARRAAATERLVAMVRRGDVGSADYVALCQELGLVTRAAAALHARPPDAWPMALRIRQAALSGDGATALALTESLSRELPLRDLEKAELDTIVDCLAPLSADAALALIRASGRASASEPALLLRSGQSEAAERRRRELASLMGPSHWLVWANLQADPGAKLEGLNHCLAGCGLEPVTLRDPSRPPSIGNLKASSANRRDGDSPLLSVVMTCFDSASHLEAALRSVFEQQHAALELIAVDDGSRDDTWARLQHAAREEPRLRPVRLVRNVGTYAAKNVGLALARGEFVAFQDADDWSHPQRFGLCLDLLRAQPDLVAVTALYVRLQEDGRFWSSKVWPLLRWTPNSVVYRREPVARTIGAFDEHRFGADSEFVARIRQAFGGRAVHRLAQPMILAAQREESLMNARSTGLDGSGRSQARADYQEAWTEDLLQRACSGAPLYRPPPPGSAALIAEPMPGG